MEAFLDARELLDPIHKTEPRNIVTGGTDAEKAVRKAEIEDFERKNKKVKSILLSSLSVNYAKSNVRRP